MGESSCQELPQAWKYSNKPWPIDQSWNRPGKGGPHPALTQNFASRMGVSPRATPNTIEGSARAWNSLIHTQILRRTGFIHTQSGSILMRISLPTRGTTTDSLLLRFEVLGLILRVLDAFRPQGATWSGQVISSPPGPSGGPSKTHLLPGGGVPRAHRARSPVPPRLPRFATPRSVHQFAAVAAGAYPPHRPPNAWSPGVPALPGPCYWLVASVTPLGWRGGCLA